MLFLLDSPDLQSKIEQHKLHLFAQKTISPSSMQDMLPPDVDKEVADSLTKSTEILSSLYEDTCKNFKGGKHMSGYAKALGFRPKFIRVRQLHEFLVYLTKDYDGDVDLDQDEAKDAILADVDVGDLDCSELPRIYRKKLDWKTFIHPVTVQHGAGKYQSFYFCLFVWPKLIKN